MADDAINIQIAASLQGLTDTLDKAVAAITRATEQIAAATERASVRHGRATGEMGEQLEGVAHHAEHLGITVAFAMEALANGAETGVHRAEHAIAGFAFLFGPQAGGITTAVVLATDYIVKFFTKAREEEEKTEKQFTEGAKRLANEGKALELARQALDIQKGTPAEKFADGINAMERKLEELKAKLREAQQTFVDYDAKTGLPKQGVVSPEVARAQADVDALAHVIEQKKEQVKELMKLALAPPPSDDPLATPTTSTATGGSREREERNKAFEEQRALMQVLVAEAGEDSDKKLAILHNETEMVKQFYGLQSKEYLDALAHEIEARTEASKKRQELLDKDAEAQRKADLEDLKRVFDNLAKMDKEIADKQKKAEEGWNRAFAPVTDTFDRMVNGILQGTQTLSSAFRNLWSDFVLGSINAGLKALAAHEAHELAKKNITAESVLERVALETWAALQTVAVNAWAALTSIANYAWTAIAATWAAISAIPIVGPFLAPAMALGAGAGILALAGNVHSAAGGFDIPAGMNPMTQLHASEMVLPAELANKIRGMTDGGGGDHYHVTLYAMDSQSFEDFARRNPSGFGAGVAKALKNNHTGLRKALGK